MKWTSRKKEKRIQGPPGPVGEKCGDNNILEDIALDR
jgi:hypothetical protein